MTDVMMRLVAEPITITRAFYASMVLLLGLDALMTYVLIRALRGGKRETITIKRGSIQEMSYVYRPLIELFGLIPGIIIGWMLVSVIVMLLGTMVLLNSIITNTMANFQFVFGLFLGMILLAIIHNFSLYCMVKSDKSEGDSI